MSLIPINQGNIRTDNISKMHSRYIKLDIYTYQEIFTILLYKCSTFEYYVYL